MFLRNTITETDTMYRELYYTLMVSVIVQVEAHIIAIAGNVTCPEQIS